MRSLLTLGKRITATLLAVILTAGILPMEYFNNLFPGRVQAEMLLNNPKIVADSSMKSGQKVTWDCVWFGNYPQTEIVDQASSCGTYGKNWGDESDYEVDASLYHTLQNISGWDSNGDITIKGKKYRRIKYSDATDATTGNIWSRYRWSNTTSYHYFRYDPIKWRVLNISGNNAFLLADIALDDQLYNTKWDDSTWETSKLRSWMNGYDSSKNAEGTDHSNNNFIKSAFSSSEQNAIVTTSLTNSNNITYGTNGGNNTNDKIFLLSESELYSTEKAESYGFTNDIENCDEARRCKSSTYAKAMGTANWEDEYSGNCWWWSRSPGSASFYVVELKYDGSVNIGGSDGLDFFGIRPALNLNLSYSELYTYAGTVCSDGVVSEKNNPSFNLSVYRANEIRISSISYNALYQDTPCVEMQHQAEESGLAKKADAWKLMQDIVGSVDDPSKILDKAFAEEDMYEGIIFALFENTTVNLSDTTSKVKNWASQPSDILSAIKTVMETKYNIQVNESCSISSLSDKQKETVQSTAKEYFLKKGLIKSQEVSSNIVKAIGYVDDLMEYVDYVSDCVQIMNMCESYKNVLQDMYERCPTSNGALRRALKECSSIMNQSEVALSVKMSMHLFAAAGKAVAKEGIKEIWGGAKSALLAAHPYAATIWAAYKSGVFICDKVFNTSTIAEKTVKINAMVEVRNVLQETYKKEESDFIDAKDPYTAENFLAIVDVLFRYIDEDCKSAKSFVQTVDDALLTKIINVFHCSTHEALLGQIDNIKTNQEKNYKKLQTDWITSLQADYPTEYEKIKNITSEDSTYTKTKSYEIACPVDIYVYDQNNKLVASVVGNKVKTNEDITVLRMNDTKELCFYDINDQYTIKYVGTDTGTMDIRINEYNGDNEITRTVKHINVPLEKNKVYTSVDDPQEMDTQDYNLDDGGKQIKPVTDTSDTDAQKHTLSVSGGYIMNDDGMITFSGEFSKGEKITICANIPDNSTWLGWETSNPDLKLSSQTTKKITVIMPDSDATLKGDYKTNDVKSQNTKPASSAKVTKISLSGISKKIAAGKKIKLTVKGTPSGASIPQLIWSSSNKKVATVNQNGVVTIKKKTGGKSVTITATAADGSGISASWKIKSMKGVVKKITISGAKTVKAGKSLKLKAKVTATKGANKKLKWTSSNTKYATVSSTGKVKTLKAGKGKKVKITAMATDGSNKKKIVTIKIK